MIDNTQVWTGQPSVIDAVEEVFEPLARVSDEQGLDSLGAKLSAMCAWLRDDLFELEEALGALGPRRPGEARLAWATADHLLAAAGKRARPICVLLAARLNGRGFDEQTRDLAVACELVHAATLLHDDVIDEGKERRGIPAAHVVYGNSASVLGGDQLFVEALRLVAKSGGIELTRELLDTISEMIAAEALQLELRGRFEPDREAYARVIRGKTAALFRFGLRAGGRLAGLCEEQLTAIGKVGEALGMAFQLVDDLLDIEGDPSLTGKDLLADLRQGKLTWPLIIASERDPAMLEALRQLAASDASGPLSAPLINRLEQLGAIEETRTAALQQAQLAEQLLSALPPSAARDAIATVVKSAVHRAR
jgi:octaprenyl-diphosphate synthase